MEFGGNYDSPYYKNHNQKTRQNFFERRRSRRCGGSVQRRRKRDLEEAITTSPVLARESGYIKQGEWKPSNWEEIRL